MSEDIYAKPDLSKKVRFQKSENEDKNEEVADSMDNAVIYDNCWIQGSTPPNTEDNNTEKPEQSIISADVTSRKRNLVRAAAVFQLLLCLFLLAVVIVLVLLLIEGKTLNNNLTMERDQLQTSYTETINLNTNLTKQRDKLQMKLETMCPEKWIKFGNSCYFTNASLRDWSNSKSSCKNLDAQLVIINSEEEQIFLSSLGLDVWIGLTDQNTHPVWKWVDGTVVNTTYWRTGQPDNYKNNEHCAEITTEGYLYNWNDLPCTDNVKFICEKVLT